MLGPAAAPPSPSTGPKLVVLPTIQGLLFFWKPSAMLHRQMGSNGSCFIVLQYSAHAFSTIGNMQEDAQPFSSLQGNAQEALSKVRTAWFNLNK